MSCLEEVDCKCPGDFTRTMSFPKLRPSSMPMKASGAFSSPSTKSSRYHDVKELKFHPAEPPKTRTLPAGTGSGFRVEVRFNKEPVGKCSIEIYNTAGKVDFGYAHTTSTDKLSGRCTMLFTGQGKEKLADGPYQAKVKIAMTYFSLSTGISASRQSDRS
ncbi:MAG TPA: hypothetical protein VE988_11460 [Gemmataceae bacterium]|nr:hypothetical protein [Gemmataceae bacterium]